ncbi:hypothetical protein K438DRAFT_1848191 [Mycena galopus ATCC 62051]|nr:hypothetical protein K438DRAFT_1848191 [Mycena galopus ATCC 62051]
MPSMFQSVMTDATLAPIYRLITIHSSGRPAPEDMNKAFIFWSRRIAVMSNAECQSLADDGDPEMMHEFALRIAAGVELPAEDVPQAEVYWTRILSSPRASTNQVATAHAHLIWCASDGTGAICCGGSGFCNRLSDWLKAGTHAEMATKLGLGTASTVISLGMKLREFKEQKAAFGKWPHFWAAVDARLAKVQAQQDREDAKRTVRPSRYKCAGPGCPVQASKGKILRACAGKCEDTYKPHYCTKECQLADWKTHKSWCKPGLNVRETDSPTARTPRGFQGIIQRIPTGTVPKRSSAKRGAEYSVAAAGATLGLRAARPVDGTGRKTAVMFS